MGERNRRILVVDDDREAREILKTALTCWGYEVLLASDGVQALEAFQSRMPAMVVSDLVMPRLDGLGLLRAIRRLDSRRPVILVTAYGTMQDAIVSMREGATDFLTKPIDYPKLQTICETLLPLSAQADTRSNTGTRKDSHPDSNPADPGYRHPESSNSLLSIQPSWFPLLKTGVHLAFGGRFRAPGSAKSGR